MRNQNLPQKKKRWLPVSAESALCQGEARRTGQSDTVDKPVARLPGRLVRTDNVGVSHDEGKVALERHAAVRSLDGNLWCRSHLCPPRLVFRGHELMVAHGLL
jgi:hypothetical protein